MFADIMSSLILFFQKMIEEMKAQRESSDEAVKKMTEQIINMKENASSSNGK